jgi:xanthine dehydrogenase accessory factor
MSEIWTRLAGILAANDQAALITILAVRGSAPREAGTRMIVTGDGSYSGTIGGGQLEWEAIQLAAGRLRAGATTLCLTDITLGPDLGQCCGGHVEIAIEIYRQADASTIRHCATLEASGGFTCETHFDDAVPHATRRIIEDADASGTAFATLDRKTNRYRETFVDSRHPLFLFGAGHVGRALVLALAPLPFRVTWVDSRTDAFPKAMPQNATAVRAEKPAGLIADAPRGAFVLIMTHSHPLDLELCRAALARSDLPYVGLIGSDTKRARFLKRLAESGLGPDALGRLRCPIGMRGIEDKAPAIIAASVAAELLHTREAIAYETSDSVVGVEQTARDKKSIFSNIKQGNM